MPEQAKIVKTEVDGVLYTPIGSNIMPVYERVYDKETGKSVVKQVSTFDIDEFIQASNCKTDLAMLRAEMVSTGQIPVVGDEVVDASLFPKNIHEVYDTVNNVDGVFQSLPASIKGAFKDKDDFMAALIDGSYSTRVYAAVAKAANEGQAQQVQQEKKEGNE